MAQQVFQIKNIDILILSLLYDVKMLSIWSQPAERGSGQSCVVMVVIVVIVVVMVVVVVVVVVMVVVVVVVLVGCTGA